MTELEKLTTAERIIAWRLTEGRRVGMAELIQALWGHREDGGALAADRSVDVKMCRLRAKFRKFGVEILNDHGIGWFVLSGKLGLYRDLLADELARNTPGHVLTGETIGKRTKLSVAA